MESAGVIKTGANRLRNYHIFSKDKVVGKNNVKNADKYVSQLVQYVSEKRITLEVFLTSN